MSDDFYPFVDSGDPAPTNLHLTGAAEGAVENPGAREGGGAEDAQRAAGAKGAYPGGNEAQRIPLRAARISVYDDLLSTPRVIVVEQNDVRTYLEDVTNTVYRTMKEQGGHLTLMIIRELVENFIHARFNEPIISILDNGDTIRFSDQGPGIEDKELAFEFGVTSANREQKRYIRGTGSGLPMIQQYVENAGGAIAIEDNLGAGTVVTVSVDPQRASEIEQSVSRGAAVRSGGAHAAGMAPQAVTPPTMQPATGYRGMPAQMIPPPGAMQPGAQGYGVPQPGAMPLGGVQPGTYGVPQGAAYGMPAQLQYGMPTPQQYGYPQFVNQFSTIPQQYAQPAGRYAGEAGQAGAQPMGNPLYVTERGAAALRFIWENTSGGPTDLCRAHGNSNGTWSRELATLAKAGLVHKHGQKYVLTENGRAWLEQHGGQ